MNDNRKFINDLVTNVRTLFPELNEAKLMVRVEEVVSNFEVEIKNSEKLKEDLIDNIKLYISSKKLEGLSELTLADYYRELIIFEYFVQKPTIQVTTADIRQYLSKNELNKASTTGKKLSVIKSFFAWLVDEEIVLRNPANKIKQPKTPKRLPKALTVVELEMVREACIDHRERALVEVMYSTACRLSEVRNMKLKDINMATGSIKVIGKGDKERIVYLSPKASFHLNKYLKERLENEEDTCEYAFVTERRPYRPMLNRSVEMIVNKIQDRSGIDKNLTPHVFRHTFATLAMENGVELGDLQQLLGHENPSTTLIYASVSEERKQNAHKRFHMQ